MSSVARFNRFNGGMLREEVPGSRFEGKISWEWRSNLLIKLTHLNLVYRKILALVTKNEAIYRVSEE
ncbi:MULTISPECIES: hypothetical protein [unclassified Microcoleus]|uniref:hypothetical protein n=1 Tax=unclassified Microcoleus TaxID=2642155 RepID=UPI002FD7672C